MGRKESNQTKNMLFFFYFHLDFFEPYQMFSYIFQLIC